MSFIDFDDVSIEIPGVRRFPEFIRTLIETGDYEREEASFVSKYLTNDDKVVELGCAIGYLGAFAKKKYPEIQWMSVDGNPAMCYEAEIVHYINDVDLPKPYNTVATHKKNSVSFYIRDEFLSSSMSPAPHPYSKVIKTISVPAVRPHIYLRHCNVLVCDIEGGEAELFTLDLDLSGIDKLIIEIHQGVIGDAAAITVHENISYQGLKLKETFGKEICTVNYYER